MAMLVVKSAQLRCSQGTAPSSLTVVRPQVTCQDKDVAIVADCAPNTNIAPFGQCRSTANPAVQAATAAAGGALTPVPCVPNTPKPWSPGCAKLEIAGQSALSDACKLQCLWSGVIEISNPGQTLCEVP